MKNHRGSNKVTAVKIEMDRFEEIYGQKLACGYGETTGAFSRNS